MAKKKSPEELRYNKYLNRACHEVNDRELLQRLSATYPSSVQKSTYL